MGLGVLYRLEVNPQSRRAGVTAEVLLGGRLMRVRSNELMRNVCRTVRWVNGIASRGVAAVAVGPGTGQVRVVLQADIGYNSA
jgi:hypothetical protein